MELEWDEAKRAANLAKHGVDFAAVAAFEWSTAALRFDVRRDYGEVRFRMLGMVAERVHAVIFTVRGPRLRIISFRKASAREVRDYEATHPS
jgi:uncharacterized DUF497 family protein